MGKVNFDSTSTTKGMIFQFLVALERCFEMQEGLPMFLPSLMGLWKKSIILSIGNTRKTRNTLDDVSFWALKTSIQHILGKMYQPSMAKAKIQLSTSICDNIEPKNC